MILRYTLEHISTKSFTHAHVLSKLIDHSLKPDKEFFIVIFYLENSGKCIIEEDVSSLPVTAKMIEKDTYSKGYYSQKYIAIFTERLA